MAEALPLSATVRVRGRFQRSVQLARDWKSGQGLENYLLTPTARRIAKRVVDGLLEPAGPRTWSITGPYGTGKSAFALFLTDLLSSEEPRHPEATQLREELDSAQNSLLPVLIVGQRGALKPALLGALAETFSSIDEEFSAELLGKLEHVEEVEDSAVAELFERASEAADNAGRDGLLVVVDEFGKFLEYAALHPQHEDLFVMQHLAEAAERGAHPIALLTMLHTAFAEYLQPSSDATRRAEWSKVQGRFTDIAFQEPPEQLLRLIGSAIEADLPPQMSEAYEVLVQEAVGSEALGEASRRMPLEELLPDCTPLDPVVALLLWPLFRSKLSQNERSLFAFLTSNEPFGFGEFLERAEWDGEHPPLYKVDWLYDYVVRTLGYGSQVGESGKRWAEIDHALSRVGAEAPSLVTAVVKAIGVVGAYGGPVGLRPSREALYLALGPPEQVDEALEYLQRASIVIYRRHENAYGLWEGSDVDLDERFDEALQKVGRTALAARLERAVAPHPVVARAHYIERGTLRYFNVRLIEGTDSELEKASELDIGADGEIVYVISRSEDRERLISKARSLTSGESGARSLRLFAFPRPLVGLEDALQEVEGWRWVQENVQAIQGDPVARGELQSRLKGSRWRLEEIAGGILGLRGHRFEPAASEWVRAGKPYEPESARGFSRWISELCDEVYDKSPTLHNELLNRERLSSAAAGGRRNLLEGMLENPDEYRLGFDGTPAEVSMYESLLRAGGLHTPTDGGRSFTRPEGEWLAVWEAVDAFLATTEDARRPLDELFSTLKRPPYGLRAGPLPVLICAYVLARQDEVALYDNGVFVPEPYIELFERLLRAPEKFEIRQFPLSDRGRAALVATGGVVEALAGELETREQPTLGDEPNLLQIVKPLVLLASRLPAYGRRTRRITPPEAVPLRDTLLRAKDPYDLIFTEIPRALGLSVDSEEDFSRLPSLLRDCLVGLQRAYPSLLDELEGHLRETFGLYGSASEASRSLQRRAEPLVQYAGSQTTGIFIKTAANLGERDWREDLARVLNNGNPPYEWRDRDKVTFEVRLREVASDFVRLEELVAEKERSGTDTQIFRIGILDGRVEERRGLIALPSEKEAEAEQLADKISKVLGNNPGDSETDRRIQLAALAKAAMVHLQSEGSEDGE